MCFWRNKEQYGKSVKYKSFQCDQRLSQKLGARQKLYAQAKKNKSRFLEQQILPPYLIFSYIIQVRNQPCRGAQNSLNRDSFQYLTPKHDVHTSGTLRVGFADF